MSTLEPWAACSVTAVKETTAEAAVEVSAAEAVKETPDDQIVMRLAHVESMLAKISDNTGSSALDVANAAVRAAEALAVAAASQSTRVNAIASETAASIAHTLEESFQGAIEKGVADHATALSDRMHAQIEDRLEVAKATAQSLTLLHNELAVVSKSLSADIENEKKSYENPSRLPRVGSIFEKTSI